MLAKISRRRTFLLGVLLGCTLGTLIATATVFALFSDSSSAVSTRIARLLGRTGWAYQSSSVADSQISFVLPLSPESKQRNGDVDRFRNLLRTFDTYICWGDVARFYIVIPDNSVQERENVLDMVRQYVHPASVRTIVVC